ncbi:hypothetical protein [Solirubrobacter soli]|uniref:hypothetical protein n=1 Tax=Solirubrobacter soli TaxID=363832 RepID=UPI0012FCDDD7|nr:hypothetical protein [Solirubrobacter soli]
MRLLRFGTSAVAGRLVAAGASREVADAIAGTLLGCGLSPGDAREWLTHERRSYPIGDPMMLSQTPLELIEAGESDAVLAAAEEFAAAAPEERTIARLFGCDVAAARRLTRSDPERTRAILAIAEDLLERLGAPERVCYVGQTKLPGHGDRRLVDRLLAGEEADVAAELADGRIDARSLERTGELVLIGW